MSASLKEFTEAELKELHGMMQRTWGAVAPDMAANYGGKSIPKSHVIEVVLDADYLEFHGISRRRFCPSNTEYQALQAAEESLVERFRKLDYRDQIKVAKQTFRYARYE